MCSREDQSRRSLSSPVLSLAFYLECVGFGAHLSPPISRTLAFPHAVALALFAGGTSTADILCEYRPSPIFKPRSLALLGGQHGDVKVVKTTRHTPPWVTMLWQTKAATVLCSISTVVLRILEVRLTAPNLPAIQAST